MERIKKRKLKFLCLFGGNDESPRCRPIQPRCPANPTTDQSVCKFEVGKRTCKQRKENRMKKLLAKGASARKRSPSILAKLMGRGRLSSRNAVHNPNATNVKTVDHSSNECRKKTKPFGSQVNEGGGLYGSDYFGDENLVLTSGSFSESEEITVSSIIVFDQQDRLTHSLSCTSESSLIREATNRMFLRLNSTLLREDVGTVNKVSNLGDMHSFPDKETRPAESENVTGLVGVNDIFASPTGLGTILGSYGRDGVGDGHLIGTSRSTSLSSSFNDPDHDEIVCVEDDADEKVYSESSNQGRREVQNDSFNNENVGSHKSTHSSQKSNGTCFENEDPAKDQPSFSDTDVDVDAQLSGPESEDGAFRSDCFESISSRLQDLKKNLHQLKVGSKLASNKLTLIPKVKHIGQVSSLAIPESVSRESLDMAHILETLENYANDPNTFSPSWESENTHHPIDPKIYYCLEEFYFEGTLLLRNEKRLFYDYVEQMFSRALKSTVAYPWVNPVKRESQRRFPKLNLADQIHNVVVEIEKDEDEEFFAIYIDKDSEWVQPTNGIDILGKLIADLVLHDLLLEVVDS
ncbi:hypothetical protein SSX86_023611 [Deinandra increscens subsp. villosa]|uniref:DUF4378 domain-containing protein n=1 Tax=Deinandra increscens subsp. villosa TaxID=3103831 RepID=A0AAP0GQ11_9ASTR